MRLFLVINDFNRLNGRSNIIDGHENWYEWKILQFKVLVWNSQLTQMTNRRLFRPEMVAERIISFWMIYRYLNRLALATCLNLSDMQWVPKMSPVNTSKSKITSTLYSLMCSFWYSVHVMCWNLKNMLSVIVAPENFSVAIFGLLNS